MVSRRLPVLCLAALLVASLLLSGAAQESPASPDNSDGSGASGPAPAQGDASGSETGAGDGAAGKDEGEEGGGNESNSESGVIVSTTEGDSADNSPGTGDTMEPAPADGDKMEPAPADGDAMEPKPADGDAMEPKPADGDTIEPKPADGDTMEPKPADGDTMENSPADGDAMKPAPADGDAMEPAPAAGGDSAAGAGGEDSAGAGAGDSAGSAGNSGPNGGGDDSEEKEDEEDEGMLADDEDDEPMKAPTGKRSIEESFQGFGKKVKETFSDWKAKIKNKYNEQMDKLKATTKKWSKSIKDKFNNLGDTLKGKIFKGNVSGITRDEIKQMSKEQLTLVTPMSRLSVMSDDQKKDIFDRFKAENDPRGMRRTFENMNNFTDRAALVDKVKEVTDKYSGDELGKERVMMAALAKMGSPRSWSTSDVSKLQSTGLLSLVPPERLMEMNTTGNLSKIQIPPKSELSSMPRPMKTAWANLMIHIKNTSKELSTWTAAEIRAHHHIMGCLPTSAINKFANPQFYTSYVNAPQQIGYGIEQANAILDKLKTRFQELNTKPTPAQVQTFVSSLGSLGSDFLTPDDLVGMVDESLRDQKAEMDTMLKRTLGRTAAPMAARCGVFMKIYMGQNLSSLDSGAINGIVNDGMLSCVPPGNITYWVDDGTITHTILTNPGAMMNEGKKRRLAEAAAKLPAYQTGGNIDLSKLPADYMSAASAGDYKAASWDTLKALKDKIKAGKIEMTPAQTAIFAQKGLSDGSQAAKNFVSLDLGAQFNELVPAKDLKDMSASIKRKVAETAPQNSVLRMASAADPSPAIPEAITSAGADIDKLMQPALPQLNPKMIADKISMENIQEVLEVLANKEEESEDMTGESGLNRKMCTALKMRLANFTQTQNADDEDDVSIITSLSASDLAGLPPCVTARLWAGTVKSKATDMQKKGLLSSLSKIKMTQLEGADKKNCENLLSDGLKVMRPSGDLTAGDMSMVGGAAACLSSGDIRRLDPQAFEAVNKHFEMACLSRGQADAIANRMRAYYGSPSEWTALPCRLLKLMDPAEQNEIPADSISMQCGQDLMMSMKHMMMRGMQYNDAMMMNCKRQIGEGDFNNLEERKMNLDRTVARGVMAAQKKTKEALMAMEQPAEQSQTPAARRRRASEGDLTCEIVLESAQGSRPWSKSDIDQLTEEDMKMCMKELGRLDDDMGKQEHIWMRLKDAYDGVHADIPIKDIGCVAAVIPADDLKKLTLSTDAAVGALGSPTSPRSQAQLEALAARVKAQWAGASGSASSWTADNLMLMGQAICGLSASDVASIPTDNLKSVLQSLDQAHWCPPAVLEKLALKAVELNGNPDTWGKAEVSDIGALIGGLEAMQLKSIKNDSMGGMTAAGVKSVPSNKIGMLTAGQVGELQLDAALAMSDDQKGKLSSEAQEALKRAIRDLDEGRENAAAPAVAQTISCLLTMVFAMSWLH